MMGTIRQWTSRDKIPPSLPINIYMSGLTKKTTRLLTPEEVCDILSISIHTLRHWTASGKLKCIKLSRRAVRYRESEINRYIESCAAGKKEKQQKKDRAYPRRKSTRHISMTLADKIYENAIKNVK